MKIIMTLLLVAASNVATAEEEFFLVPEWDWVEIVNFAQREFSNGSQQIGPRDTCGIEYGGELHPVSSEGDVVLVEYKAPGFPMGTPCPSGVMFLTSWARLDEMTEQYVDETAKRLEKERLVMRLTGGFEIEAKPDVEESQIEAGKAAFDLLTNWILE